MLTDVNVLSVGYRVYGKLFSQMYDGTLGTKGPWQALVTFQQFVILADKNGEVDITPEAISRRTTIPLEIIQEGIKALEQPDPDSRSPELEGRRIARLDENREWGWKVVNYAHYRAIRSQEERREYMKLYQRKRRAVNKNVSESTGCEQNQPIAVSRKQYAVSIKTLASSKLSADVSPVIQTLPTKQGQFDVRQSLVTKLEPLYPKVDIPVTLREMKGWLIGNPERQKTNRGIKRFITSWLQSEQEKADGDS